MEERWCICLAKAYAKHPSSYWAIAFDILSALVIALCGMFLNYKLHKILKIQKKNRPFGRKGNVIEPIVGWFCLIQIVYWPYQLLLVYSWLNNIIPLSEIPAWVCAASSVLLIVGSTIVAYNSLFVALIRYVYIVYERKANQWDFETIGRRFKIASLLVPSLSIVLLMFTLDLPAYQHISFVDNECKKFTPVLVMVTTQFVPKSLVDVFGMIFLATNFIVRINLVEGFLYFKIFQTMKRYISLKNNTVFTYYRVEILVLVSNSQL